MTRSRLAPGRLHQKVLAPLVMRSGMATTLMVPGRSTGEPHTLPVNVLDLDGEHYLVSVRGESAWVRFFDKLPDPADHAVFRLLAVR